MEILPILCVPRKDDSPMKKIAAALGVVVMLSMGLASEALASDTHSGTEMAFAQSGERVVPYPAGLDTSDGASAAPSEINHSDSIYYPAIDYFELGSSPNRVMISHYPTYQQTTEYTCGPASALTVLYYYGIRDYDEMSLAKEMKTQGYPIGTNPANMVKFFQRLGWKTESSLTSPPFADYDEFKKFAIARLRRGIPIIVENVEWGGHWRVIIGYDDMGTASTQDDTLIMMDAYDVSDHRQDGYTLNNGSRFYAMWFDHSMLPKEQREQPWIVAWPEK